MFKSLKTSHYINTFLLIFFTMLNLVVKVEALLLQESFDTLCRASVIYLTIENNILLPYDKVQKIVNQVVNSSLVKLS